MADLKAGLQRDLEPFGIDVEEVTGGRADVYVRVNTAAAEEHIERTRMPWDELLAALDAMPRGLRALVAGRLGERLLSMAEEGGTDVGQDRSQEGS